MIKRTIRILTIIMIMAIGMSFNTYATYADDGEDITVRVKATLPENFKSDIAVRYTGKTTDGFTTTLSKDNGYTLLVQLKKDVYVYKESSVIDGYYLEMPKTFSLENATKDNVYVLSIAVISGTKDPSQDTVDVCFKANLQDTGYSGNIAINYTGTDGNEVLVTLNKSNGYISKVAVKKDIYTLKTVNIDSGFTYDCLYSFSLADATNDNEYDLQVKVIKQKEVLIVEDEKANKELEEEKTTKKVVEEKTIAIKATVPSNVKDFNGTIYITYLDGENNEYTAELSPVNTYMTNLSLPLGSYKLGYAVSYETSKYQFTAQPTIEINQTTTEDTKINVLMLKDGEVLKEDETSGSNKTTGKVKAVTTVIIALVAVLIVFIKNMVKKNKKPKAKKETIEMDEDYDIDEDFDDDIDIEE